MARSVPTPENITGITYQLLQVPGNPNSVRGNMPQLIISFDNEGFPAVKSVSFQELLPYMTMLKAKSDALGKVLVSRPDLTYNNSWKMEPGDAPGPGGGFAIVGQPSNGDPCVAVPDVYYIDHGGAPVVGDIVYLDNALTNPLVGFDNFAYTETGVVFAINSGTGELLETTAGVCPSPPVNPTVLNNTFKVNGVAFDESNALTGVWAVNSVTTDSIVNGYRAYVVNFTLPQTGTGQPFTTEDNNGNPVIGDYMLPANCGFSSSSDGLGNWDIFLAFYGLSGDVNFVDTPVDTVAVEVLLINSTGSLREDMYLQYSDGFVATPYVQPLRSGVSAFVPKFVGMSFTTDLNHCYEKDLGQYTIRQYEGAVLVDTQVNVSLSTVETFLVSADVTKVEFQRTQVLCSNDGLPVGTQMVVGTINSFTQGMALLNNSTADAPIAKFTNTRIVSCVFHADAGVIDFYDILLKKAGLVVQTVTGLGTFVPNSIAVTTGDEYDEIAIVEGGGAGVAVDVKYATLAEGEVSVCTNPTVTVWTDDGTIAVGKTVFTNPAMTTFLPGQSFIVNPLVGTIFNITPLSGDVSGVTGNTC